MSKHSDCVWNCGATECLAPYHPGEQTERKRLAAWERELQTNKHGYASSAERVIATIRSRLGTPS